jgi:hypothetical protein
MTDAASFVLPRDMHSMPLLAHLEELRKRIIFSVLGVIVGFLACWSYSDRIFGLAGCGKNEGATYNGVQVWRLCG